MGFKVNFMDNQKISADDINAIAEGIDAETTASQIFSDGETYGVEALNSITADLITKGVSTGCDVSIRDGMVFISQGVAFFEDGKKITIDTEGITLAREEGDVNYVWLSNDNTTSVVSAKCTLEEPSGDYVNLATVSQGDKITEKKDKALMKNSSLLPNSCGTPIYIDVRSSEEPYGITTDGNYKRMVAISKREIVYMDWEKMVGYSSDKPSAAYDLSDTSKPISIAVSADSSVSFISYDNNILTVSKYRFAPGTGGDCTIYLM